MNFVLPPFFCVPVFVICFFFSPQLTPCVIIVSQSLCLPVCLGALIAANYCRLLSSSQTHKTPPKPHVLLQINGFHATAQHLIRGFVCVYVCVCILAIHFVCLYNGWSTAGTIVYICVRATACYNMSVWLFRRGCSAWCWTRTLTWRWKSSICCCWSNSEGFLCLCHLCRTTIFPQSNFTWFKKKIQESYF